MRIQEFDNKSEGRLNIEKFELTNDPSVNGC